MVGSKIFLKKFTMKPIKKSLKQKNFGMSIDSLMIWLPIWLNLKVDLFGLAKIMMVMFRVIVWLRDMDLWD